MLCCCCGVVGAAAVAGTAISLPPAAPIRGWGGGNGVAIWGGGKGIAGMVGAGVDAGGEAAIDANMGPEFINDGAAPAVLDPACCCASHIVI